MVFLPLVKLGTLAVRTLAKPLASRLKTQAAHHHRFRHFITAFAQAHHKFLVNLQRRLYGQSTDVEVRPLNPEKAVKEATDLFGELVIFSVAAGAVLFEVQRSARSEARKEEARRMELETLRQRDEELLKELQTLKERQENFDKFLEGRGFASWFPLKQSQIESQSNLPLGSSSS